MCRGCDRMSPIGIGVRKRVGDGSCGCVQVIGRGWWPSVVGDMRASNM